MVIHLTMASCKFQPWPLWVHDLQFSIQFASRDLLCSRSHLWLPAESWTTHHECSGQISRPLGRIVLLQSVLKSYPWLQMSFPDLKRCSKTAISIIRCPLFLWFYPCQRVTEPMKGCRGHPGDPWQTLKLRIICSLQFACGSVWLCYHSRQSSTSTSVSIP